MNRRPSTLMPRVAQISRVTTKNWNYHTSIHFFFYYRQYIPGIVVLALLCAGHWCSTDCAIVSEVLFTQCPPTPADNAFNESLTWNFVHASQSSTFCWWPAFTPHSTACKWMLCDIKFALALSRRLGPISSPREVTRRAVTLNGLHRCARWAKRFWCILIRVHVTGSASGLLGGKRSAQSFSTWGKNGKDFKILFQPFLGYWISVACSWGNSVGGAVIQYAAGNDSPQFFFSSKVKLSNFGIKG